MIAAAGMNNERLGDLIEACSTVLEGQPGYWRVDFEGRELWIMSDEHHDRMRIMTPIVADEELEDAEFRILLEANFDRALDARYAVGRGYLWAAFMHPFYELSENLFHHAMAQVKCLADNFRGSYSSGGLVFGGGDEQ